MLKIENTSNKTVTATTRNLLSGADGQATTIEPGATANVLIDANNQLILSTTGAEEGEGTQAAPPEITIADADSVAAAGNDSVQGEGGADQFTDASDDEVNAILLEMRATGTDLTNAGVPKADALNGRLATMGRNPVSADRRTALFEALPPA